jgi:hypothetical protein
MSQKSVTEVLLSLIDLTITENRETSEKRAPNHQELSSQGCVDRQTSPQMSRAAELSLAVSSRITI